MKASIIPNEDVEYLDSFLLDDENHLKVLPYATYAKIPRNHLLVWAVKHAVYTYPTQELIDWLREKIGGRKAIEICAGHGSIGRALDLTITDSFVQTRPEMISLYNTIGQAATRPPSDVYQFEANEAVDFFKPKVVIGSYVTQLYQEGDSEASVYGVDETAMLPKIETYIMIGNEETHGNKRIIAQPHEKFRFDWLLTRNQKPENNCIYVWDKK